MADTTDGTMRKAPRGRRRSRFSIGLRGLMLLVLAAATFLGWRVNRARTQQRAVAAIRAAGGTVEYDWERGPSGRVTDARPWAPDWLRRAVGDEYFQEVVRVYLEPSSATDESERTPGMFDDLMGQITDLDRLESVTVRHNSVTPRGLAHLTRLPRLVELDIGRQVDDNMLEQVGRMRGLRSFVTRLEGNTGLAVSPAGLAHLTNLTKLRNLELARVRIENAEPSTLAFLRELTELEYLSIDLEGPWHERARMDGACLAYLRGLTHLKGIELRGVRVSDADLANVAGLSGLESLDLDLSGVTDAGLAHLASLTNLQRLRVMSPAITDAGLAHLRDLTRLRELFLFHAKVSDAGMAHLARFGQLEKLSLRMNGPVTEAGLAHLADLSKLKRLSLPGPGVTDAGLAHLAGLSRLLDLNLRDSRVSDAGLVHLAGLTKLADLDLSGTRVTDAGMAHLVAIPRLRDLKLNGTAVGLEGLRLFRQVAGPFWLEVNDTRASWLDVLALRWGRPRLNVSGHGSARPKP
jgi:internalin A